MAPVVLLANGSIAVPLKSAVLGAELLELELTMLAWMFPTPEPSGAPVGGHLLVLPPRLRSPSRKPFFVPVQTSL